MMRNQPSDPRCRCWTWEVCPVHTLANCTPPDETTAELDTRELPVYDDDCEDTLPDAGAETSHR
jgi:hypothetical protein